MMSTSADNGTSGDNIAAISKDDDRHYYNGGVEVSKDDYYHYYNGYFQDWLKMIDTYSTVHNVHFYRSPTDVPTTGTLSTDTSAPTTDTPSTDTSASTTDAPNADTSAPITDALSADTSAPITDALSADTSAPITDAPRTDGSGGTGQSGKDQGSKDHDGKDRGGDKQKHVDARPGEPCHGEKGAENFVFHDIGRWTINNYNGQEGDMLDFTEYDLTREELAGHITNIKIEADTFIVNFGNDVSIMLVGQPPTWNNVITGES
ncbi:hypothetical protein BCL69_102236 [Nitrosomonas communis]|uniref:Uncharacterized protein n=2 Tax=Nitrosomonas communis TaxID=44574 RepID=A0A5D3YEM0_9PROT|nr:MULTISPECIES: hypothetical protein [Nitrosomonas]TYP88182.1 hypothetical protein BCL69_102236 [Nitrosomonas communis]